MDGESLVIRVNEDEVYEVNHDEHGWAGMEAVETVVKEIADTFDIRVVEL